MVTVWIARRVPPAVWNSTGLPVSPRAGATCVSPTSCLASRIAASTLRPARSAGGRVQPGHRRAGHVDEPAVPGDVGPQAVAEQRHAADLLDEGQVVDALDVDVVARRPEPGQVSGRQPEDVRVGADVTQGDGRGRGRRRPGQRAVEAADLAGCAGQRVEVDDRLRAGFTGQGPHGHRGLQRALTGLARALCCALARCPDGCRRHPACPPPAYGVPCAPGTGPSGRAAAPPGAPAASAAGWSASSPVLQTVARTSAEVRPGRRDMAPPIRGKGGVSDPAPGPLDHTTGHAVPVRGGAQPSW